MITIGMNYTVLPGKEATFEKAFRSVLAVMNEAAGHTESHLFRDVTDAQRYLIVSDWNDEDAFNAFIRSEQFANVTNWGAEQILAGRPKHDIYRK